MSHADEPIASDETPSDELSPTDEATADEPTLFDESRKRSGAFGGRASRLRPQHPIATSTRGERVGSIQIRLPPQPLMTRLVLMMTPQSLSTNQSEDAAVEAAVDEEAAVAQNHVACDEGAPADEAPAADEMPASDEMRRRRRARTACRPRRTCY